MLLNELRTAIYLGYTSTEQWRRAKKLGHVPAPDVVRGEKPVFEFWLEDSLVKFVKGSGPKKLSDDKLRKRIEQAARSEAA